MSAPTKPDVGAKGIEHLDFTPLCQTTTTRHQRVFFLRWQSNRRCKSYATWMATLPCCGQQCFCCDYHRYEAPVVAFNECGRCGEKYLNVESWKWDRI